jgi:AraC-like DNA-binding protein
MPNSVEPLSRAPGIAASPRRAAALRLSHDGAPEQEAPILLRSFFEPLGIHYEVSPLGSVPFDIDITVQSLPGLMFLAGRMHGLLTRRTRKGSDPIDDVGLMVNLGGRHLVGQRGQEIELGDGEATLVSLTDPLESTQRPPGGLLVLRFARPLLAPLLSGSQDRFLRRIPGGTPALRLLTDYMAVTRDGQSMADRLLQRLIVTHILDLTAVSLGATRDAAEMAQGRGVRAAQLHAVKVHIAANLDRSDLSVEALALRLHCTPRFIQRLFETEGTTFTEYLLTQRLGQAHRRLIHPRYDGEKIGTVARDCGFGDISYFNRVFRRHYGSAPSEVRAQARHDPSGKSYGRL